MGFFRRIRDIFSGSERRQIVESYKAEFRRYDDGHLRQICRAAMSDEVREAAVAVLRERGCAADE